MDSQNDLTEAQLKLQYQTLAQKLLNNEIRPEQIAKVALYQLHRHKESRVVHSSGETLP